MRLQVESGMKSAFVVVGEKCWRRKELVGEEAENKGLIGL